MLRRSTTGLPSLPVGVAFLVLRQDGGVAGLGPDRSDITMLMEYFVQSSTSSTGPLRRPAWELRHPRSTSKLSLSWRSS
ncbi:hypothetical protein K440DRAFT_616491 [Wilcoxina mikolae CBS 423.85]|nr:hypothetical protein K440DRAFT_616491 [Wilcoxina mikolae CBS 423.85]